MNGAVLVAKLRSLTPGAMMALVDAAERFWSRAEEDTEAVLRDLGLWREEEAPA